MKAEPRQPRHRAQHPCHLTARTCQLAERPNMFAVAVVLLARSARKCALAGQRQEKNRGAGSLQPVAVAVHGRSWQLFHGSDDRQACPMRSSVGAGESKDAKHSRETEIRLAMVERKHQHQLRQGGIQLQRDARPLIRSNPAQVRFLLVVRFLSPSGTGLDLSFQPRRPSCGYELSMKCVYAWFHLRSRIGLQLGAVRTCFAS